MDLISKPNLHSFHGHWGYFFQNLSQYPLGDGEFELGNIISAMLEHLNLDETEPRTIRFMTFTAPPYVSAKRDTAGFEIAGPMYSLVSELTRFMNYSIKGICIDKEDRHVALLKYAADFVIEPIYPQVEYTLYIFEYFPIAEAILGIDHFVQFSRAADFLTCDCLAFRKEIMSKELFSFFKVFDCYSVFLLLFLCFLIPLTITLISGKQIRHYFLWLFKCLELFLNNAVHKTKHISVAGLLFGWILTIWILKQFVGGDMFSRLSATPKPKIIDSWADLKARPELEIIALDLSLFENTFADGAIRGYFNPDSDYYEDFTNRLSLIELYDIDIYTGIASLRRKKNGTDEVEIDDFDLIEFDEDKILMIECLTLRQNIRNIFERNHKNGFDQVHFSSQGGETVPYFYLTTMMAEKIEYENLNKIISMLTESGIYHKWVWTAVYGFKEVREWRPSVSYGSAQFNNFFGPLIICCLFIIFAFIALLFESMTFQYRKRRAQVFLRRNIKLMVNTSTSTQAPRYPPTQL